jgi:hypothetical protein
MPLPLPLTDLSHGLSYVRDDDYSSASSIGYPAAAAWNGMPHHAWSAGTGTAATSPASEHFDFHAPRSLTMRASERLIVLSPSADAIRHSIHR